MVNISKQPYVIKMKKVFFTKRMSVKVMEDYYNYEIVNLFDSLYKVDDSTYYSTLKFTKPYRLHFSTEKEVKQIENALYMALDTILSKEADSFNSLLEHPNRLKDENEYSELPPT